MMVKNKEITIKGKFLKTARVKEEWYVDVDNPSVMIEELKKAKPKPDLFTFWQRFPHVDPKYDYYMELESIAILPITTFDHWWKKQINAKTRNVVRKAEKNGVEIKIVDFDDDFVKGLVNIFNETPVRQGKPFWHYGKDFKCNKKRVFEVYISRRYDRSLL